MLARISSAVLTQMKGPGFSSGALEEGARGWETRVLQTVSFSANNIPVSRDVALPPPRLEEIECVFGALSHEARRHIVQLLSRLGGELPSGYVAKRFGHSWPTTTRHLHVLEAAGLVSVRREGRSCVYRLERDRLRQVVGGWLSLLDPPTPEETWRSSGSRSVTRENRDEGRSHTVSGHARGRRP
jgi:DNA-binding transcriptional ArsR family regulator